MIPFAFLCLTVALAADPPFLFQHKFSSTVSPCDDFNEYVCNLNENEGTSWTDELQNRFMHDLLTYFNEYSDPIIDFIRQIYARDLEGTEFTYDQWFALNRRIILSNEPAPYVNFIVPKLVRENGLWMPDEKLEELKDVYRAVNEEIVESIKEQSWIPQDQVDHVTSVIGNVEPYLYFPEASKDPDNIKIALKFFDEAFVDHLQSFEKYLSNPECGTSCLLAHLNSFLLSTLYKYIDNFSGTPEYIHYWLIEGAPFPVGAWNSLGGDAKMAVLPAMSHYMNHTLPRGLLYSTIAWQIGHEIFHNVDSSKWGVRGASGLHNVSHYERGFQCFADFYGSFPSKAPNGTFLYPDGQLKQNEGFCDVEGFRVALKAVKKLLERTTETVESDHSGIEWFFLGAGLTYCHRADDYSQFVFLKDRPHPRFSVRINAVALQTSEFSEVFKCKPGDPMYFESSRCEIFTS
ncbi:hypothetical protein QR680_008683 [Steinernema hermaphroditum]|uniref:Peptidase M13 C-terminal domain-containing protein n=1 Tax=Steinernema hermaphroditum TaxID=289476 RepID=A0AA39M8H8_9BILA|nr:hypothetical protein QR680_008683 [Steinernema hermaphroditum]